MERVGRVQEPRGNIHNRPGTMAIQLPGRVRLKRDYFQRGMRGAQADS